MAASSWRWPRSLVRRRESALLAAYGHHARRPALLRRLMVSAPHSNGQTESEPEDTETQPPPRTEHFEELLEHVREIREMLEKRPVMVDHSGVVVISPAGFGIGESIH